MEDVKDKTGAVNNGSAKLTEENLAKVVGGRAEKKDDRKCPYGKERPDPTCDQTATYCEHVKRTVNGNHSCDMLHAPIPGESSRGW